MPKVSLRYFAQLREARGMDREDLELPPATTAAAAYQQLFPQLSELPVGYAVNGAIGRGSVTLQDGDELVFLPPVGGG